MANFAKNPMGVVNDFLGTGAGKGPEDSKSIDEYLQNLKGIYGGMEAPTLTPVSGKAVTAHGAAQTQANAAQAGPSAFNNIRNNPAYTQAQTAQMAALSNLAKNGGRSAASDANLAQIQQQENANAQGQRGAIMQNMQARGMGGSGNSLLAQLSSSQSATNNQSARDLGVAGQQAQTALAAGQGAASIGSGLQQQNYAEQANRASAQDAVDRFNAGNTQTTSLFNAGQANDLSRYNAGLDMGAQQYNSGLDFAGQQYNSGLGQTQFADLMGIKAGQAGGDRAGLDYWSKKYSEDQMAQASKAGGLFGVAGSLVGNFMGGGGSGGSAAGSAAAAAAAHGGAVPGHAAFHGDTLKNDTVPVMTSPGEVIVPRTLAQSGSKEQIHDFVKHPPGIKDKDHAAMMGALQNLRRRR